MQLRTGLAANSACPYPFTRHRQNDVNMCSAWLCSRSDIAANVEVMLAAGAVVLTRNMWPDILADLIIAALFLPFAASVSREANAVFRVPSPA